MPDEVKVETPKAPEVKKISDREKALESALRDAVTIVEDQAIRLQRMGISMRGTGDWMELVKGLLK
jgi:hypothetical protein